jgi:acyl-CoA synthetase (AMP-forming)/AMP-acid ligase II
LISIEPPSVVFEGRHWSSQELIGIAARWRDVIREDDRIFAGPLAMVMANHPQAVALFFALSSFPVPLILLPPDPRAWRSSPHVPAGTPLFLLPLFQDLSPWGERGGFRVTVLSEGVQRVAGESIAFLTCPGLVMFTSGSTSIPRPVYRSTAAFLDAALAFVRVFHLPPGSGVVGVLPFAYTHGLGQGLLTATVLGGRLGLLERFDHRSVLALFASGDYHFWAGTPVMADILGRCPLPDAPPAPHVCTIGGGKIPDPVFRAFLERFGIPLRRTYGTTEAGHIAADTSSSSRVRPETVGRPFPEVEVCIGDTPHEPFPPGRTGIIWIKNPWEMEGYGFPPHLEPGRTRDGWSPTSDIGFLDEAGYLTLIGRTDDCVKLASGYLVNLADVAAALTSCPGVTGVAVVPLDGERGPAIGALVEGETLDPIELRRHITRLLPSWSHPQVVQVTARLPCLPGGKTDRRACVEILEQSS